MKLYSGKVEKIQVWLKSNKNGDSLYENLHEFMSTSDQILLGLGRVSDKVVETIKTRSSCPTQFNENRAVYDIITKNTAEPDKP